MHRSLTREEAARRLGLPVTSPVDEVKRAYRRLAREHHPDHGGDPDTFQHLHVAYERMLAQDARSPASVVSRGRPSRPPAPPVDDVGDADVDAVAWDTELPAGRRCPLDRDRLAVWLVATTTETITEQRGIDPDTTAAAHDMPAVNPLVATSRAPGSRLNRVAHLLATELTAELRIADAIDDRGRPVVGVEVVARNRRGRRALDRVGLDDGWVRTRGSSSTRVRATLAPSRDRRSTVVRVSGRLEALLEEIGWPLSTWTLVPG